MTKQTRQCQTEKKYWLYTISYSTILDANGSEFIQILTNPNKFFLQCHTTSFANSQLVPDIERRRKTFFYTLSILGINPLTPICIMPFTLWCQYPDIK